MNMVRCAETNLNIRVYKHENTDQTTLIFYQSGNRYEAKIFDDEAIKLADAIYNAVRNERKLWKAC